MKKRLKKGWYVKARRKWLKKRVWKWTYYASDSITITPWAEWKDGHMLVCDGICPSDEDLQRITIVTRDGYWAARHFMLAGHGKVYVTNRI